MVKKKDEHQLNSQINISQRFCLFGKNLWIDQDIFGSKHF